MNSEFRKKRIKDIARRIFSAVFSLVLVFESVALVNADDVDVQGLTYQGYKWTRIYSQEQMRKFYIAGKTDKDKKILLNYDYGGNQSDNDPDHWFKALIVYSSDQYFVSGINRCNDGESYKGARIYPSYGIDTSKDEFTTRSGLYAPYIRYCGLDKDNNCDKYYIRFANDNDSAPGSYIYAVNLSWYGAVNASAIYSKFIYTPADNPGKNTDRRAFACHVTEQHEHSFRFSRHVTDYFGKGVTEQEANSITVMGWVLTKSMMSSYFKKKDVATMSASEYKELVSQTKAYFAGDGSIYDHSVFDDQARTAELLKCDWEGYDNAPHYVPDGCLQIFYNIKGAEDRFWRHPDNDYEIEMSKSEDGEKAGFKLYIGQPNAVSTVIQSTEITAGITRTYNGNSIAEGVEVSVPKGAVLVIEGTCYNNGRLRVNGGTVIVNGSLDSDFNAETKNKIVPGTIILENGGTMVISDSGVVVTRNKDASIEISGYSSMTVNGSLVSQGSILLNRSTFRSRPGSAVLIGFEAGKLSSSVSFGRKYIKDHSGESLSSLGSVTKESVDVPYSDDTKAVDAFFRDGRMVVNYWSSAYCDGIFFCAHSNPILVYTSEGAVADIYCSTNIDAKISGMMRYW